MLADVGRLAAQERGEPVGRPVLPAELVGGTLTHPRQLGLALFVVRRNDGGPGFHSGSDPMREPTWGRRRRVVSPRSESASPNCGERERCTTHARIAPLLGAHSHHGCNARRSVECHRSPPRKQGDERTDPPARRRGGPLASPSSRTLSSHRALSRPTRAGGAGRATRAPRLGPYRCAPAARWPCRTSPRPRPSPRSPRTRRGRATPSAAGP
jgi:hypothetical protein